MNQLIKPIKVRLLPEAEKYFGLLNEKTKDKFFKSFDKTQIGLKGKWLKSLNNSDGIWEFSQRDQQFFYRILAFWDHKNPVETLIIATHGFNKKSNKSPPGEIQRAERIKTIYFQKK